MSTVLPVDYDAFMNVPKLDAQDRSSVQKIYKAESFDFRLKPGSAAVDKGLVLPNVTDGFGDAHPISGRSRLARHPYTTARVSKEMHYTLGLR